MKHKMSILFYVKSSKAARNGLLPIYQRITINRTRIELSTSKFVEKSKWNLSKYPALKFFLFKNKFK